MTLTKRDLLKALAALGTIAASGFPAHASCVADDTLAAGQLIGRAWIGAHPDADLEDLRIDLLPNGLCDEALTSIRKRIDVDFDRGALFEYEGWRLSETEAQLFALLAAA